MTTHHLAATPQTVRFGIFDAEFPPVLTIQSGDSVVIETFSGGATEMPASGFTIAPAHAAIHAAKLPQIGPHLVTGPVAIEGAQPGDMLEVRIDRIEIGADWGWCGVFPLFGTLQDDFPERDMSYIPVDRVAGTAQLPWGPVLKLSPFFGVMGNAPSPLYGPLSSKEPRQHGGNLDNRELQAGSSLFLPVLVPGANFSCGDGHGMQGDGEVCGTALEICLTGHFTFILHPNTDPGIKTLKNPRAETPTHYISMGIDEDLFRAHQKAVLEMTDFICMHTDMTRIEAYKTCSLAVDFHVTQTVNGEKGVHGMLAKGVLF